MRNYVENRVKEVAEFTVGTKYNVYKKAITEYGEYGQLDVVIEEMAELTQAISKFKRGKNHNVEEEVADVEIMLEQMRLIFDSNKIEGIKREKILRLEKRLKED
ncbi:hypothetical protein U728_1686 [Clostridium botulinum 202F]|uniref:hypothetical protein n=1 Tax=unclassified Clostridium TaxID=2614128 RepID=UPI00054115C9|nr:MULTISPECIES: hypothetical protein [unclassified Clostridium]AIY81268.1 hypothetical protein U728_1686 [Clostridium botulinum 202F]KAI3347967.1 hypothetical protein CIT17_06850 [Clostridium botulinum]